MLFLPADIEDIIGKLEGLSDDLGEGFFMKLGFLGHFDVIVVDSLVEDAGSLLNDLLEI